MPTFNKKSVWDCFSNPNPIMTHENYRSWFWENKKLNWTKKNFMSCLDLVKIDQIRENYNTKISKGKLGLFLRKVKICFEFFTINANNVLKILYFKILNLSIMWKTLRNSKIEMKKVLELKTLYDRMFPINTKIL